MTETAEATNAAAGLATAKTPAKKKAGGLNSMLLPELKQLAGSLGIKGITGMRKSALIEAISATQSGARQGEEKRQPKQTSQPDTQLPSAQQPSAQQPSAQQTSAQQTSTQQTSTQQISSQSDGRRSSQTPRTRSRRTQAEASPVVSSDVSSDASAVVQASSPQQASAPVEANRSPRDAAARESRSASAIDTSARESGHQDQTQRDNGRDNGRDDSNRESHSRDGSRESSTRETSNRDGNRDSSNRDTSNRDTSNRDSSNRDSTNRDSTNRDSTNRDSTNRDSTNRDSTNREGYRDDERGGSRNSRRRNRNRDRTRNDRNDRPDRGGRERTDAEPQVSEDDVLVPVAGILDLLDNYAFVRTSGYLPGPNDVYVALSMVRRYGLRKGDAITGAVRQTNDGGGSNDRREKFNPIARIDSVNGADPETAKSRVEFAKLTPLYASERLRLETEQHIYTTRLIDIVAPIGKGQRGLIVAPSKAGKTMVMQAIANAVTTNNPECHLMVVLVDERPEEVTEMQRAVKGEVISSTFDRPADDHTTVAELAIERAKRLVELGHDVFVLLDSITKLGRAYNLSAPASGRIMSGGVDSSALYPPKRFFGAARNIEDGGSLTILATALIETGSKMDEVIFEEFKGTGNMELRLRREFANKRIFPAIDVDASGTRREELLMSKDELAIVWKLRRVLSALDGQQALELLLEKLRQTKSNVEFLMQVNKTTPTAAGLRGQDDD